ncbi:MAG: elongation factor P hydroxylase [Oleiphilaceae bacterium]|nr:elongation factor P hydroxylase [Oleiphilaceae bacterium]
MSDTHQPEDLIRLFARCFESRYQTRLVRGDGEPEYLPADGHWRYNRVIFAHGHYASALHEISHWCIAGARRRQLPDYGYWYCPDGRDAQQQALFEQVEVRPQAIEWHFARAAGSPFHLSLDNLSGETSGQYPRFREAVWQQAQIYLKEGLPARAACFRQALLDHYQRHSSFGPELFTLHSLT